MTTTVDFPVPEGPFRRDFNSARDPRTATNALRVQPGVHVVALDVSGNAVITLIKTAATDVAASAAGVPINGLYRTSAGAVMCRIS